MRKDFDDCVAIIESDKIKSFVEEALALAPENFWKDPSSSNRERHPPEDCVEGGIIVHSRKAVRVALELFSLFDVKDELAKDKIIAALILHDIQKRGMPWGEKTDRGHGLIAYCWLLRIASAETGSKKIGSLPIDNDLLEICLLVKNHMGIWSEPSPTPAVQNGEVVTEYSLWNLVVQLADYWASRKFCPFICDEF